MADIFPKLTVQRCANTLKPLRQVSSFRKESKTTTFTKSKPSGHVLSCLDMFLARSLALLEGNSTSFLTFRGPFFLELYMPLRQCP